MEKQDQNSVQSSESNRMEETESIYKGLENVPLKVLDLMIGLCVAALVIVIAVGVLNR